MTGPDAPAPMPAVDPSTGLPLPSTDQGLWGAPPELEDLALRWELQARLRPIGAEQMRGTDARARRLGVSGRWLMEQAGAATAASVRALMTTRDRSTAGSVLILCGPGNNGGDGLVAARYLARTGIRCEVVLLSGEPLPSTADAARNWERLEALPQVVRHHAPRGHDVALFFNGIERAAIVVDALLGTGVRGLLREPVRTAVDVAVRAFEQGVPVLAVDGPTALDLSTGEPSEPVVLADATVTFHRPKQGLLTAQGRALAGRVLVAPIGIPVEADRG